jgi:hypothetical protein
MEFNVFQGSCQVLFMSLCYQALTVCCCSHTLLLTVAAISAQALGNVPLALEFTGQTVRCRPR